MRLSPALSFENDNSSVETRTSLLPAVQLFPLSSCHQYLPSTFNLSLKLTYHAKLSSVFEYLISSLHFLYSSHLLQDVSVRPLTKLMSPSVSIMACCHSLCFFAFHETKCLVLFVIAGNMTIFGVKDALCCFWSNQKTKNSFESEGVGKGDPYVKRS